MGFLDRIKELGSKLTERPPAEKVDLPKITFDLAEQDEWVEQAIQRTGAQKAFDRFVKDIEEVRKHLENCEKKFVDENVLAAIPERARTVNALHGREYATQLEKVMKAAQFVDLWEFDADHETFRKKLEDFSEHTGKNVAALKEFMHDELQETQEHLQKLEDRCLKFLQEREENQFGAILQMRDALRELHTLEERQEKFRALREQLQEQLTVTKKKRAIFQEKIAEHRKKIRNPVALEALDTLTKLETDLDELVSGHDRAAQDVWKYYEKHKLTAPAEAQVVLRELPKQPERFLAEHAAEIHTAFDALADQLEQEGRGKLGNLITRLREKAASAEKDAERVNAMLPEQQELKKSILRDVAAINIYDQQQFVIRTARDLKELEAKIAYVDKQLEPTQRITLERNVKDAAIALGATITGEEEHTPIETASDEAATEVQKGEELLEHVDEKLEEEPEQLEDIHFSEDAPEEHKEPTPEPTEPKVFIGPEEAGETSTEEVPEEAETADEKPEPAEEHETEHAEEAVEEEPIPQSRKEELDEGTPQEEAEAAEDADPEPDPPTETQEQVEPTVEQPVTEKDPEPEEDEREESLKKDDRIP